MYHIVLLGYLVALMVGVAAAVTAQQFCKTYQCPFLRLLVRYVIFLNLALFLYFVATYLEISSAFPELCKPDSVFMAILYLLAIGLWAGCLYSYVHLVYGLRGREVPGRMTRLIHAGLILVGVMCVIGVTTYVHTGSNHWNMGTYLGLMGVSMLVFAAGIVGLLRHREPKPGEGRSAIRRRSIRNYAWLHVAAYGLFFSAPLMPGTLKFVFMFAAVIGLNLAPLVWLRRFFLRDYVSFLGDEARPPLDAVVRKHEISAREREVMGLILEGKSNQEIEKTLFISYNTVKNHIYSIYRKLGVKSRSQMIHLVLEALKRDR
jgi:DNA-binding CsgD family transcriptional regulator